MGYSRNPASADRHRSSLASDRSSAPSGPGTPPARPMWRGDSIEPASEYTPGRRGGMLGSLPGHSSGTLKSVHDMHPVRRSEYEFGAELIFSRDGAQCEKRHTSAPCSSGRTTNCVSGRRLQLFIAILFPHDTLISRPGSRWLL